MTDLVAIARKRDDRIKTHWEGCEEQHTECLIRKMADEIERLRSLLQQVIRAQWPPPQEWYEAAQRALGNQ